MSGTQINGGVNLHTGNEQEVQIKNLMAVRNALAASVQAEADARAAGDDALAALIASEIASFRAEVTTITNQLASDISDLDNRLANRIVHVDDEIARLDLAIEAARALESGEISAVKDLIEQAAIDILESGKIEQIAARLNVILNGVSVTLPDAIKALWSRPVLKHTTVNTRDADGYATSTTLEFMDGRTAITSMTKNNLGGGVMELVYSVADFLGLGIVASGKEVFTTVGDITRQTGFGELTYTMPVEAGTVITPEAPDVNGDGTIGTVE